jgi:hypothetical protein
MLFNKPLIQSHISPSATVKLSPIVFMSTLVTPLVMSKADKPGSLCNLHNNASINHSQPGDQMTRRDSVSFSLVGSGYCLDSDSDGNGYLASVLEPLLQWS